MLRHRALDGPTPGLEYKRLVSLSTQKSLPQMVLQCALVFGRQTTDVRARRAHTAQEGCPIVLKRAELKWDGQRSLFNLLKPPFSPKSSKFTLAAIGHVAFVFGLGTTV